MSASKLYEHCSECDALTGRAGAGDGSIYIEYSDGFLIGPLCDDCRGKCWVCDECGLGVENTHVTFHEWHDGCGGQRS